MKDKKTQGGKPTEQGKTVVPKGGSIPAHERGGSERTPKINSRGEADKKQ